MSKKIDLLGRRFGRLTVIASAKSRRSPNGLIRSFWLCRCDCGQEKEITGGRLMARNKGTKSCGCFAREFSSRKGVKNPNFKGGRSKNQDGYVILLRPVFPGCENYKLREQGRRVPEHIVVMARHLGRPLHRDETVHHRNGIRDDNRIDNLELKASSHGRGQTIPDLLIWAKEILSRYETPFVSPCCV